MNDDHALIDDIKGEIAPIINFLQARTQGNYTFYSLRDDISFKEFKSFFPDVTKKQLIKLFDMLEANQEATAQAFKEVLKK